MRILPDGTVEIKNSVTGETKIVKPQELGQYNPTLIEDYNKYQQASQQQQNVSQGLPADYQKQQGVLQLEKEKTNLKNQQAINPVEGIISSLENHYQNAGGGKYTGPLGRILGKVKSIEGGVGLNSEVKTYEDLKTGFLAALKGLTGDVGILTDTDEARLAKLIPELGATPQESTNKFNDLRAQLAAKYGAKGQQTTINPGPGEWGQSLVTKPVNELKNFAQDVGSGIAAPGVIKSNDEQRIRGEQLLEQIKNEQDPKRKQLLIEQARGVFQRGSQEASNLAGEFSPDVNRNPIERGLSVGADVAQLAGIGSLLSGGVKTAVNIAKKPPTISSLKNVLPTTFSKSAATAKRDALVKVADEANTKFSGKPFQAAIDKLKANRPDLTKAIQSAVPENISGKEFTTKTLVEKIADWSAGTYKGSGEVYSKQISAVNDLLAKTGRNLLRKQTPELAKQQALIHRLYGQHNILKFLGKTAAQAGAAGVGFGIGGKLMGGGGARP